MKKLKIILFSASIFGLFTLASCGGDAHSDQAKQEIQEAADAVGDAMQAEKEDLKREINDATADIDRRIEKLKNDIKEASAETKAEMQAELDTLESKRKQLAQDLESFGDKTESEWNQFKDNVRETMKDLGDDNKM